MLSKRRWTTTGAGAAAAVLVLVTGWQASAADERTPERGLYQVRGADTAAARTDVDRAGVDVLGVRDGGMEVVASPEQAAGLRGQGLTLTLQGDWDALLAARGGGLSRTAAADFPAGDEGYHTYAEMVAALRETASAHPEIAAVSSIGSSHEGRDIPIIKISDNVASDEDEPEVLFTCNMHAREHLTTEMCLRIVERFTAGYGSDAGVTAAVDAKEIWVVPSQNPDGAEFDIAGGEYAGWRKNRQPNSDGSVGTDTNRNFDYKWGCCGGSSTSPSSETYRGPSAASAPEVRAVQDFVGSRVVGGTQQIKGHIDFHTFSELVLWPFGHTYDTVTDGMTAEEYARFESVGEEMAASNGYTGQQSSALYVTDGSISDWMWGEHKILSYCFEMYPAGGGIDGFYPPDEQIVPQTTRNDGAVDILIANAT
ncbi:M14 family metallopeptidase [Actinokineospora guangxiensis]|uniref:M14 family metallopeptidase n=1 Tax=Actinokineospora guangxiensis TaxID=1490288 RepID=A0ABW0EGI5_9PSEU